MQNDAKRDSELPDSLWSSSWCWKRNVSKIEFNQELQQTSLEESLGASQERERKSKLADRKLQRHPEEHFDVQTELGWGFAERCVELSAHPKGTEIKKGIVLCEVACTSKEKWDEFQETSKTSEMIPRTCGGGRLTSKERLTEIKPPFSDSLLSAISEIVIREFGTNSAVESLSGRGPGNYESGRYHEFHTRKVIFLS